uniref:Bromo domain-containing protein n=1 Tax=Leptobrachium leishanense TaxID=445787 RepID=A0A8C5MK52_9ANUR
MQTSESGISAKSLRGRDSTRKQDASEKDSVPMGSPAFLLSLFMGQELHRLTGNDWDKITESWSTSLGDFCNICQDENEGEGVLFDRHLEIAGVQLHAEAEKVLLTLLHQMLSYLRTSQQAGTTVDGISVFLTHQPLSETYGEDNRVDSGRTSDGKELHWLGHSESPFSPQSFYGESEEFSVFPEASHEHSTYALGWPTWETDTSDSENNHQDEKTETPLPSQPPLLDLLKSRASETPEYLCNFKKMMNTVWKSIVDHRFSGPFVKPVSDKQAPGYEKVVKKPMDFTTIKRGLMKGRIKDTVAFQRDLLLVFQNAIMYNNSSHTVYHKAVEMQRDMAELLQILNTR